MAIRSVQITLQNNTDIDITLIHAELSWTNNVSPPATINAMNSAIWESHDDGWFRGTEGWVKYQITNSGVNVNCVPELLYVHWNNPFVWDGGTKPADWNVTTTDQRPPCHEDQGSWDPPGGFPHGGTNPQECTHQAFLIWNSGGGVQGISWWDVVVNWPALLALTELGQGDINLGFNIGLRTQGSVLETVKGQNVDVLAVCKAQQQPSLRKLFHL
jgi:hypothetical protein